LLAFILALPWCGSASFLRLRALHGHFEASNVVLSTHLSHHAFLGSNKSKLINEGTEIEANAECGVPEVTTSKSHLREKCPKSCPLYVTDKTDPHFCSFKCIKASNPICLENNPATPIADQERGICRRCQIAGCKKCMMDGSDTCADCNSGYRLEDGICKTRMMWAWYAFGVVLIIVLAIVLCWIFDVVRRPIVNVDGLNRGLVVRSRAKLHMPADPEVIEEGEIVVTQSGASHLEKMPEGQIVKGEERCGGAGIRKLRFWPLFTNCCSENVAGAGVVLQFNFQASLIVWGFVCAAVWAILGYAVDNDLFRLGTRMAKTPREYCILVFWGYETQNDLMWTKVLFCVFVYVFSFLGAIFMAIRSLRQYQKIDENTTTYKDFSAQIRGLPKLNGDIMVEEELQAAVAKLCPGVIGVSVCWDISDKEEVLMKLVEEDLEKLDTEWNQPSKEQLEVDAVIAATPESNKYDFGLFSRIEHLFLHPATQRILTKGRRKGFPKRHKEAAGKKKEQMVQEAAVKKKEQKDKSPKQEIAEDKSPKKDRSPTDEKLFDVPEGDASAPASPSKDKKSLKRSMTAAEIATNAAAPDEAVEDVVIDVQQELRDLQTCECAFIVFDSETERDQAIDIIKEQGLEYRGSTLGMERVPHEPFSVVWNNMHNFCPHERVKRIIHGVGIIIVSLAIWVLGFYLPYAYAALNFNYGGGNEPGFAEAMTFTMIVCVGNVTMYLVCSEVADRVQFQYTDDREVCYMLFYTVALVVNVILDLACSYYIALAMMTGIGMKTYHGENLEDVNHFTEQFETYGMQKEMGATLMAYNFPATFLIPFLIEPIATILVPYVLMTLLVRSHRELAGVGAEAYLAATPMDLSRYADVLLNVMLCVLILFFPGGYNMKMFLGLACSHVFIYLFDQYRVLRSIPKCEFSEGKVDWWAQWLLCVPCGLVLTCLVYKSNCEEEYMGGLAHCDHRGTLIIKCLSAFLIHVIVHTLILVYVVPWFGFKHKPPTLLKYKVCATRDPASWFALNPVYCLRSKYMYEHNPPCDYMVVGKEHLMRANPEQQRHFQVAPATVENFDFKSNLRGLLRLPASFTTPAKPSEEAGDDEEKKPA